MQDVQLLLYKKKSICPHGNRHQIRGTDHCLSSILAILRNILWVQLPESDVKNVQLGNWDVTTYQLVVDYWRKGESFVIVFFLVFIGGFREEAVLKVFILSLINLKLFGFFGLFYHPPLL